MRRLINIFTCVLLVTFFVPALPAVADVLPSITSVTVNSDGSLTVNWNKTPQQDSYVLIYDTDPTLAPVGTSNCTTGMNTNCMKYSSPQNGTPLYCYFFGNGMGITRWCVGDQNLRNPDVQATTPPLIIGSTYYIQVLVEPDVGGNGNNTEILSPLFEVLDKPAAIPTPTITRAPKVPAATLNSQNVAFLANESATLSSLVQGLVQNHIANPSTAKLSVNKNGRKDVWTIDDRSQVSTPGFDVGPVFFTKNTSGSAEIDSLSGNVTLVENSGKEPKLPSTFSTYNGGQVIFGDGKVSVQDSNGNVLGEVDEDVQAQVEDVFNTDVPPLPTKEAQQLCKQGKATSASNARIFSMTIINSSTAKNGTNSVSVVTAQKVSEYNCTTQARRTFQLVDINGETNGKSFTGLSYKPLTPAK